MWCVKSGCHCFSCQSLLLGTSAPNDKCMTVRSHTRIYVSICAHTSACACTHVHTQTLAHPPMHNTHTHLYTHMHGYMYVHMTCAYLLRQTLAHTRTHTYT